MKRLFKKSILASVEIILVIVEIILSVFWMEFPQSDLEPFVAFTGVLITTLELTRRYTNSREKNKNNLCMYKRKAMDVQRIFKFNKKKSLFTDTTVTVTLQSLNKSLLSRITNRIVVNRKKEGNLKNMKFYFLGGHRKNGSINFEIYDKSTHLFIWSVLFSPPLVFGEIVTYSYRRILQVNLWSWEKMVKEESLVDGKFINHWAIKISTITEELKINVKFPPGYPISFDEDKGLYVVYQDIVQLDEKQRIVMNDGFNIIYHNDKSYYEMSLYVNNPIVGASYGISWIPPREKEMNMNWEN